MRRKFLLFTMMLITFTCIACDNNTYVDIFSRPVVERPAEGRKEWNDVSSFVCYYGDFDIEFQSKFDVVIMHTNTLDGNPEDPNYSAETQKEYAKAQVKALQDAGCYVVSYITIGEDDSLSTADGLGEGGYASYYVYENGVPKMNTNWKSWFVDAGNPVWQAMILEEAGRILDYGVDGLFMDTLDTVDIANNTIGGMADLVKKLKETYPEAKLVANRGFTVLPYISQYIDGLMFESFNTTVADFTTPKGTFRDLDQEEREWNELVACNTINAIRRYDYFPVFVLDYVQEEDYDFMTQYYYDRTWQYDFIPYSTYNLHLNEPLYPVDENGELLFPKSVRGELALSKLANSELSDYNGDMSKDNLAYKDNGVTVKVSSTFQGYDKKALNDGWFVTEDNHIQSNWSKESWASTDNKNIEHWIEFSFDSAKEVSQVVVHWANDNDTFYSPKRAYVEAEVGGEWIKVAEITNTPEYEGGDCRAFEPTWVFNFNAVTATKIRVVQPKASGAHDEYNIDIRSGIMWVSEIEIYKEAKYDE